MKYERWKCCVGNAGWVEGKRAGETPAVRKTAWVTSYPPYKTDRWSGKPHGLKPILRD
ncbi:MAG: hypothetical protein JXD22_15245 [Sedimentisphaerales bacterium]|nr:hypothetical protein [Sedimentisphaerales bacterium]